MNFAERQLELFMHLLSGDCSPTSDAEMDAKVCDWSCGVEWRIYSLKT